jgi:hypothetical protein
MHLFVEQKSELCPSEDCCPVLVLFFLPVRAVHVQGRFEGPYMPNFGWIV